MKIYLQYLPITEIFLLGMLDESPSSLSLLDFLSHEESTWSINFSTQERERERTLAVYCTLIIGEKLCVGVEDEFFLFWKLEL